MSDTEKASPDHEQARTMTDDEATNMRLERWWLREMELLQGMVDEGKLSGPSIGMAARGLWNMAYKAGRLAALEEGADAEAYLTISEAEVISLKADNARLRQERQEFYERMELAESINDDLRADEALMEDELRALRRRSSSPEGSAR